MEAYHRCSHGCIWYHTGNIVYISRSYDHVTERTQARLFEERIQGCNQQGANLCGADARPTDELSLAMSGEGEQRV